ncbi:hypothetical protein F5B19DRAFT_482886 [Rostrohypoxylon terebratum]|nr:hypothetical protein F5B19DRAFT_482886 [Rostrohypoxylon terebratum]
MAANMPQMAGGGTLRRPAHQQLSQLVYTQMMQQQTNHIGGWQDQVQANLRVSNAMNLISNSFLAMPAIDSQQLIMAGLSYERDAFVNSPDKATYDQKISGRVHELFKQRQAHEHTLQHSLNAQAAAQAQAQMMMNQGMMSRGMGQPAQGFQHLQQPMQPSPIPQQPHQTGMSMGGPGGLPMNPNQQGMQMRAQMPGHPAMANLPAQDRTKVVQLAMARLNQTGEAQRNQLRMMLQSKLSPHQLQTLQQENMDPVLFFFQNQILQAWKGQAGANGSGNQSAMQMQAQRQMNQSRQQLAGVANGEFGPFSNVESIMNQQKAGLLAQEAGQMVVPASNGSGRNATPQPMGGVQGPNPNNHPGPNQSGMPNQLQQQFNLPQAQQLKMDQRAAQSQAQIRAQAQAKQMQGQPGGLNGPGPISQSPGMNTLNTPVRRTPIGMGQGEGQPQMGQPNGPFVQGLDPRFNQGNQRPPMAGNSNAFNAFLGQMSLEQRQVFMTMPAEKRNEILVKWSTGSGPGRMAGRGQPPQPNQFAQNNPMAQFGSMNNAGQQPNPHMPMNPQNQMLFQHQLNRMRSTMQNQNRPQGSPDTTALMDSMDVPPKILEQLRGNQPMPLEIKKWGQLKQFLMQKSVNPATMNQLQTFQNAQFQSIMKQRGAAGNQMPQHNMPPQGPQPSNAQMPMAANPAVNMGFPGITVTAQEMQNARNYDKFKAFSDEKLRATLLQMKVHSLRQRAAGQNGQAPNAQTQTSQPGNANIVTSATPAAAPNVLQQRHQNTGPDPNVAGSAVPARNNRPPQNNRPQPTQPTAPPQKVGVKRTSTDDVVEVPNPSSTPVQRPPSQQAKAPGNMSQALQLNSIAPEQRAKIEAAMKSRQAQAANGAGGPGAQQPHMSEEMQCLKAISQEEHMSASKESYHEIQMTPEQYQDMGQKIQSMVGEMTKISKILRRWYTLTKDDNRARMFFRMRLRLLKQFVDGEKMTTLKKAFSLRPQDLDGVRAMLEGMARDVASQYPQVIKRNGNAIQQQNTTDSGPQQGTNENMATPPTGQPAPLNAANLEKQTQALNKMHQRTGSRSGQPPAAPTTSQPPFPFGAQSPNGQPTYIGKATVTQADLHLPARKRVKTATQPGVASGGPSANSSPQVQKAPSPEMVKRQTSTEAKAAVVPKLQFPCSEPSCEAHGIAFATDEARQKHIQEEHIKPYENPFKFVTESLATALGLDPNGKPKAAPNASVTAPGASQTSISMTHDASRQGLTPASRADATPMSREPSMKRQGSATGPKPTELAKTIAGRIATPKLDTGIKPGDSNTGSSKPDDGRPQAATADGTWSMMTVDPQDLFQNLGGLEGGGGGAISNMDVYRAITPNDTPESSKDSASSEPNSDVSEGVSLNLQLNMGLDVWNPFGGGPNLDVDPSDMDISGAGDNSLQAFSWDDIQIDWNKEFQLDTSLYSMDTT